MTIYDFDFEDSLEELRSQLTWRLGTVLIAFGIGSAWYTLIRRDLPFFACAFLCLLVVLGRAVQIIMERRAALAHQLLVWGLIALLLSATLLFPDPWLLYLSVICVFLSATLIQNGGLLTAVIIAAWAAVLDVIGGRAYPLIELATTLGLAAASSWLSAYTLFT